ncbi:uncharacterized protein EDB93DRAFT_1246311 [Suillus bovinus]|uniref:uncharacterized protein n=1 Tax=Suillus bovinus TaxID=48563 RepID=UPI001B872B41|nr:uncharacterized protein EDB93DRAFT_1246311 [Suillus bovinus]KAG2158466.1 hypothetical protein EDB93DRAFT_1246311 [Suillus bovinus]
MPSLRRSFSSLSVRSNPYPTSLSNGSVNSARTRVAGHGSRRSSDSEVTERRVLADIEWWRVSDGQRDLDAAQDQAEPDQELQGQHTPPLMLHDLPPIDFAQSMPMSQFAVLSMAPHSPTGRRHGRDSSVSSLESTPEIPEAPLESIRFSMIDADASSRGLHSRFSDCPPALSQSVVTSQMIIIAFPTEPLPSPLTRTSFNELLPVSRS